jgi:hypothetical protein
MGSVIEMPRAVFDAKKRREEKRSPLPRKPKRSKAKGYRNSMLAKIHIAKKQLGMSEDEYRAFLCGRLGVDSAKDLTIDGLKEALEHLTGLGWETKRTRPVGDRHGLPAPLADKHNTGQARILKAIEALLSELGRLRGKFIPWDYAASILKRQTGLTRLEYGDRKQLTGVLVALENVVKRSKAARVEEA